VAKVGDTGLTALQIRLLDHILDSPQPLTTQEAARYCDTSPQAIGRAYMKLSLLRLATRATCYEDWGGAWEFYGENKGYKFRDKHIKVFEALREENCPTDA